MAGRFVRSSKYRASQDPALHIRQLTIRPGHVFGRPTRKEQCYDNLRISRNAWDTNLIKVVMTRDWLRSVVDTVARPIQNTSRSTGRQVVEALSRSYQRVKGGGYRSAFHCLGVIPLLFWIPTGEVLQHPSHAQVLIWGRNPFNDSLICSGSDDGKVAPPISVGNSWLTQIGVSMESAGRVHAT
jgi:Domain of unknown function (DUF1899)